MRPGEALPRRRRSRAPGRASMVAGTGLPLTVTRCRAAVCGAERRLPERLGCRRPDDAGLQRRADSAAIGGSSTTSMPASPRGRSGRSRQRRRGGIRYEPRIGRRERVEEVAARRDRRLGDPADAVHGVDAAHAVPVQRQWPCRSGSRPAAAAAARASPGSRAAGPCRRSTRPVVSGAGSGRNRALPGAADRMAGSACAAGRSGVVRRGAAGRRRRSLRPRPPPARARWPPRRAGSGARARRRANRTAARGGMAAWDLGCGSRRVRSVAARRMKRHRRHRDKFFAAGGPAHAIGRASGGRRCAGCRRARAWRNW